MEVSGLPHAPAALSPLNNPLYPVNRRLGGSQIRSRCFGEEKNDFPFREFESFVRRPGYTDWANLVTLGRHIQMYCVNDVPNFR